MIDARLKVFRTFSLTAMVVPLVVEAWSFATGAAWSSTVVAGLGLSLINGLAYAYTLKTNEYQRAFRWSIWPSFGLFAWTTYLNGGIHADHFDYVYLFIFANVFFLGSRTIWWSAAAVVLLTAGLALAEHLGQLPAAQHPLGPASLHFVICQVLAAWLIFQFEHARRDALSDAADQRELMQATLDHSPAMHFTKDLNGRFVHVNRAFAEMFDLPVDQILGRTSAELLSPEAGEYVARVEAPVLAENQSRTFESAIQIAGRTRLFTSTLFPIRDPHDRPRGLGGILIDNHDALTTAAQNKALTDTLNETALMMTVDLDGRIVKVNDNFCAISGFTKAELIGRASFDHSPAYDNHLFAVIRRAVKLKRSWTGEIHEVTRDGREYYLGAAITPIAGVGERTQYHLVTCFDITPQILAETQYRSLVETMEEGVVIWDEHGSVVQTNRSALRIMEMTHDELLDRETLSRMRVITDVDGRRLDPQDYPAAVAFRRGEGLANQIVGLQTCDGRQRWISINSKPTVLGGRRVVVCTLSDVSDQRRALAELQIRAEELHSLFHAMTEGMYLINTEGRVILANRAASHIMGYPHEDIIGANAHYLFHHSHADGTSYDVHDCPLYASLTSGKLHTSELDHFWRKDGVRVPVSTTAVPVEINGQIIGSLVTFRDLTNLKRLEDQVKLEQAKSFQSAKLASLGEMSAGIAHEINNPLAIVNGSLEMLNRYRDQPEKFVAKMQAITKATARIGKIVLGLQKFARANTEQAYHQESLSTVVADSVVMTETKARRHDVTVTHDVAAEYVITCDVVEIEQVLINLINNAVDAIKDLPERWIDLAATVDGKDFVLKVTDSGPGIPPETEAKLFQPFFTTKPVGQGTGLGLSIAKGILEQHGATIGINRQVAHTCFEIRFTKWERVTHVA